jgi:hypothetical protein
VVLKTGKLLISGNTRSSDIGPTLHTDTRTVE